jgi:class 3 adenylate cyclase
VATIRPDFINLHSLTESLRSRLLKDQTYSLLDSFGNVISQNGTPTENWVSVPISCQGINVASLKLPQNEEVSRWSWVSTFLDLSYELEDLQIHSEEQGLWRQAVETLMQLSGDKSCSLDQLLMRYLGFVRSFVWVERASVFGIVDGISLEGLATSPSHSEVSEWKISISTIAGQVAANRRPYLSDDPSNDPSFVPKEGVPPPRNLVCHPLLHGETIVGVLNLANKIGGSFTEADLKSIAPLATLGALLLQKTFVEQRLDQITKTSSQLGKYLSSKVVRNVTQSETLSLGGSEKKVVCLFSDIRGYTSLSENTNPALLVQLLNFYFEKMHAIIEKNEGTLDKIVGDLIMAVWNIPHDQPEPELLAVKAALEMQKEMKKTVVPEWSRHGVEKVGMGVGVNSGTALVGNLGSSRFMNYTVIGDTVNTAQRLEAKARSGEVWISESVFQLVDGKLPKPSRKEHSIHLKGKDTTIDAYVYNPTGY